MTNPKQNNQHITAFLTLLYDGQAIMLHEIREKLRKNPFKMIRINPESLRSAIWKNPFGIVNSLFALELEIDRIKSVITEQWETPNVKNPDHTNRITDETINISKAMELNPDYSTMFYQTPDRKKRKLEEISDAETVLSACEDIQREVKAAKTLCSLHN
jgi:hypothetical protein